MAQKRFKSYSGPRTTSGLPDRRTAAGKAAWNRSEAAKRGWETRREREKEKEKHFPPTPPGDFQEWIIEEPIETVGGKKYGRAQ